MNPVEEYGEYILARKPSRAKAKVMGSTRRCAMEGCCGVRIQVRWHDGTKTWPCTRGLVFVPRLNAWRIY